MAEQSKPKKIIYVENGIGYGGAIICLRHLVRNLDRTQFEPMVVTGRSGPQYESIAEEALWRHIPDRRIDIVALRTKLNAIGWLNKVSFLRYVANQVAARADDLCNFLPFFIQLLWTAWRFQADLIHANNEPLCNRAALLVAKMLKIPGVCHVRGDPNTSKLGRWAYSLTDHFISVSHWVADCMRRKLAIPDTKISVVYDGIALDKLELNADGKTFRKDFNIPEQAFAVGLVGLLIPWKGQELFIEAARSLKNQIPDLKMIIIGGTPDDCLGYEKKLRRQVDEYGLSDMVVFTGHIGKMEAVYKGLDIVVSASTAPEPLGTVIIEAMAMGRPLIGPNHGGAAEMLTHEEHGLLFVAGNSTEFAIAVQRLYQNPELANSIGNNAQKKAFATFSVFSHTENVQNVYKSLLKSN